MKCVLKNPLTICIDGVDFHIILFSALRNFYDLAREARGL